MMIVAHQNAALSRAKKFPSLKEFMGQFSPKKNAKENFKELMSALRSAAKKGNAKK